MKPINYDTLSLDELRQYVLNHREDTSAFYAYIERSKTDGKMISVDLLGREDNDQNTRKSILSATAILLGWANGDNFF